jgi:hypothetical protein
MSNGDSRLPLTADRIRAILHYDPETGVFTRLTNIRQFRAGECAGFLYGRNKCYRAIKIEQRIYHAHRLAWLYVHGRWPADQIDHINGDGRDNRIANLREATNSENAQNKQRPRAGSKTGVLGVSLKGKRFRAILNVCGRQKFLGLFDTPQEAHEAYVKAKRAAHPFCAL